MNVFKGVIITCDDQNSVAKYLVENEGKVVYVGNELPETFSSYPVTDLENKAIIPSFVNPYYQIAKEDASPISFSKVYVDSVNFQIAEGVSYCNYVLESDFLIPGSANDFHSNFCTHFNPDKKKSKKGDNEKYVINLNDCQYSDIQNCEVAHKMGKQILIHVKGEAAYEKAVVTLTKILADSKDNELRHSIVIDSSLADVDFSMCRKFKIGLILESDFSKDLFFPLGNCVRNNVSVSLALKNRPFEFLLNSILSYDERVKTSVYEVLRCLTYNGAKSCHSEKNVGSLEKGKCADFLILNHSPYACD
ncbi:MAG: amidohydrolase family protein, partial [Treponemataceae bacterium]|nr:amidohydrolase family protein [Treponemataceae bacterium]